MDVSVWRGCGDGTFETTPVVSAGVLLVPEILPILPPVLTSVGAVADFNGDGRADLALVHVDQDIGWQQVALATGRPDGTFAAPAGLGGFTLRAMPNAASAPVFTGDLNGDGLPDLLFQTSWSDPMLNTCIGLVSMLGDRSGLGGPGDTAGDTACLGRQGSAGTASVGNIVGDGHVNASFGFVFKALFGAPGPGFSIFDGSGDGTFVAPPIMVPPASTLHMLDGYLNVTWRDLDRDGLDDAVAFADGTHPTQIFWNDGGLSFSAGPLFYGQYAGDFDGDGNLDLETSDGTGSTTILFGDGARGFARPYPFPADFAHLLFRVVDVDGDGVDDLFQAGGSITSIYLSTAKHPLRGGPDVDCPGCVGPTGF
jgi:hypothetical protein